MWVYQSAMDTVTSKLRDAACRLFQRERGFGEIDFSVLHLPTREVGLQMPRKARAESIPARPSFASLRRQTGSAAMDLISIVVALALCCGGFVAYQPAKNEYNRLTGKISLSVCPDGPRQQGTKAVRSVMAHPGQMKNCLPNPVRDVSEFAAQQAVQLP